MQALAKIQSFNKPFMVALAILLLPSVSIAQLEEITVTAQKRTESLQDVPIAVTAYTGEMLESLNVNDASDLVDITPGLNLTQQGGSNRNYFLRAVGTTDFHLTSASAVGQYFDDITLTSGFHARAALFDMERVEVLKGPQNTLYGLNTTGGAVNYISRKPEIGAGTNGNLEVQYGNDNHLGLEGALGFDLGTDMAGRVAIHYNKHDGPFESITNGVDYGDDDLLAYRAAIAWELAGNTNLLFNLHGSESKNNGTALQSVGTRDPDMPTDNCDQFTNNIIDYEAGTDCVTRNTRNGAMAARDQVDPSASSWEDVTQNFGYEDVSTIGVYAKLEHDFGWAAFHLVGAYDNLEFETANDTDGTPLNLAHLQQADDRDTYQIEARLVSSADDPLRWIGGIYYLDENAESFTGVISPGIGGGARIPNVQLEHTKENLGIYGQIEYDLTEQFTFTAGVRWSDEEINADYLPSSPTSTSLDHRPIFAEDVHALVRAQCVEAMTLEGHCAAGTGTDNFLDANGYDTRRQVRRIVENEDVGYTIKLDWKVTEDSLLYASYSKGFKGGAADIRAAFALVPPANVVQDLDEAQLAPEALEAWEVGYKGAFYDNSIQLDMAAFYYDYTNLQIFVTSTGMPTLDNAPASEIYGLDGNVKYANNSGFYLDVGFSLLKSEVTDSGTSTRFFEGAELSNTPAYSLSVVATQDFAMGDGGMLTLTMGLSHTDDMLKGILQNATTNTGNIRTQPAYTLLDANATYRFGSNEQYKISVFGKNLTNEHFCGFRGVNNGNASLADGIPNNTLSGSAACRTSRDSTRTFGASIGYEF